MARQAKSNVNLDKKRNQVIDSVKSVNCMFINMAEGLIEETVSTGTKYQRLAVKAIKKSEPIIEKQVDLIFDSVEMAIDQVQANNKRFQRLLGITKQVNKAKKTIGKLVENVSDKVEEGMEDANKTIQSTFKQAKKETEKAVKVVKAEAKKTRKTATKSIKAAPKKTTTRRRKTA